MLAFHRNDMRAPTKVEETELGIGIFVEPAKHMSNVPSQLFRIIPTSATTSWNAVNESVN